MPSKRVVSPHPHPLKNWPSLKSHCLQKKLPLPTAPPPTPRRSNPLRGLSPTHRPGTQASTTTKPGPGPGGSPLRPDPSPPVGRPSSVRQWGSTPSRQPLLTHHPYLTEAEARFSALLTPSKPSQGGPRTQPTGALLHSLFGIHAGHVTAAAAAATAALAAAAAALTLRATGSRRRGMR